MKEQKIAIVGGGIAGMVIAKRLVDKGFGVTIFEKDKQLGGLMAGFRVGQVYLEKTYHHIFGTDRAAIDLIDELGLAKKLVWLPSTMAVIDKNGVQKFGGAIDLIKFRGLDLVDKIRLGLTVSWLKYDKKWERYEKISAEKWLIRMVGKRAYEIIWRPLLEGKFGDWYKQISMAWLWARIHVRANSSRLGQGEKLGYMIGGFEQIIAKLEKELIKKGVKIKTNFEIRSISDLKKKYDKVIWTGASQALAKTISDEKVRKKLAKIKYLDFVNLIFASRQKLSDFYWHNINDKQSPFLAFVQHTNLVDKVNYQNLNIYYAGSYRKKVVGDQEMIRKEMFDYVSKIFSNFDKKQVVWSKVYRFKEAQHVVGCDYEVIDNAIDDKLYLANFSQIYPYDRGINYSIDLANNISKTILQQQQRK